MRKISRQKSPCCNLLAWLIVLYVATASADSGLNPHTLENASSEESTQCLACHKQAPTKPPESSSRYVIPNMEQYVKTAISMCTDCHGANSSSHIVGVTPDYTVPADLPLNEHQQVTCLTCHYTHGSLDSDKPMASTSFMDYLFNREHLSKSYVLRRNNADGDLCLACHSQ